MKKLLSFLLIFAMGWLLLPTQALAATTADVARYLQEALRVGNTLGAAADKDRQATILQNIKESSAKVDERVYAVEADPTSTPEIKAKLQEFKIIWADFQKTRDQEIIPAVIAGDFANAQRIRTMYQSGRILQMFMLLRWQPS